MKVIGIGASAGGLNAITVLFENLPPTTGAAYVIIQHLSADFKSMMDELLGRHTKMPIKIVNEPMQVRPNHIYLIPIDRNIIIREGELMPVPKDPLARLNLPIDLFFHSLGKDQKANAVGVILSGTGTDGSRGIRTIKEEGGLVLVQDPGGAKFDGMPKAAISLGVADSILSPFALASKLLKITNLQAFETQDQFDENDPEFINLFEKILERLLEVTTIDFNKYRRPTLFRRTLNRMRIINLTSVEEYYDYLLINQEECKKLANDFLICVTRFFRNQKAFTLIKAKVIPEILKHKKQFEKIRIWVPGCATGEEAYSIALLFQDYLSNNNLANTFKVFATDIDKEVLDYASEGIYSNNIAADISPDLLSKYFDPLGNNNFQVKKRLRDHLVFARHNILNDPPFINMDLITCRNVLIYMRVESQQQVLQTFHYALNDHGHLFLGPSESMGKLKENFIEMNKKWRIYKKDVAQGLPSLPNPSMIKKKVTSYGRVRPYAETKSFHNLTPNYQLDAFSHFLAQKYAPVSLFVNAELKILYINGNIGQVMDFPQAFAEFNLNHMLNEDDSFFFWNGVRQAIESGQITRYKNVILKKGENPVKADLRFEAISLKNYQYEAVVHIEVTVDEHPVPVMESEVVNVEIVETTSLQEDRIKMLDRELKAANRKSQMLVHKLETTNEELQTSNEELLTSNEELQSSNEELQSVNEELFTVNTELQVKIDELATTNNDINNLLKSTDIGTIFLDKDLKIRKFTPAINKQFDLVETDFGRSITNFSSSFRNIDLVQKVKMVADKIESYEEEVVDIKGNHYLMRILPYRTDQNVIDGIVITFIDINALVKARRKTELLARKFSALYKYSRDVIVITDREGVIQEINSSFAGYKKEELPGSRIYDYSSKEETKKLEAAIRKVFKDYLSTNLSLSFKTSRNRIIWMDVAVIPAFLNDKPDFVTLIMTDVTELKRSRALIEETAEKYRSLFDNSLDQLIIVNRNGIIKDINFVRHKDTDKSKVINRSVSELFQHEEFAKKCNLAIEQIFEGKAAAEFMMDYQLSSDQHLKLLVIVSPVIISGKIKFASFIIHDTTNVLKVEREYAELKLRFEEMVEEKTAALANANEELAKMNSFLDSFVHGAAHDLRSPLVVLKSYVDLIRRFEDEEKKDKALANMKEATIRLENTLQGMVELIDFQKNEEHVAQKLDFEHILKDTRYQLMNEIEEAQPEFKINFKQVGQITYIKAYLTSIIYNLISNAIKYRALDRKLLIEIETAQKNGFVVLLIKDNGIGMDLERYGHLLFKPFKRLTSEKEGTGIGLSIIKSVIEKNGGKIEVKSRLARGTTFEVFLKPYNLEVEPTKEQINDPKNHNGVAAEV